MAIENLTLSQLVTVDLDVEPYLLDWPGASEEPVECQVLVVSLREGGLLLAVPVDVLPEEVLLVGNSDDPPGVVGPSTVVTVPSCILENGSLSPTGQECSVLVVDMNEGILDHLHSLPDFHESSFSFDPDQPFAVPEPVQLLAKTKEWLVGGGTMSTDTYFSLAQVEPPVQEENLADGHSDGQVTPRARKTRKTPPAVERQATGSGKKPTVSSLAQNLEKLLQVNSGLSQQIESLHARQSHLEKQVAMPSSPNSYQLSRPSALRQPISDALKGQRVSYASVAQQIGTPPRTAVPVSPGVLQSHLMKPPEIQELEAEKDACRSTSSDPLGQAVLAQSQALTALVSQIAAQGSDAVMDLGSGTLTSGTRGATGRAKLQAELASQKGLFFRSILASMARRMSPTLPTEGTPEQLMERGICGTKYLERFGGFGRHRDLGCLQHQIMTIMDFLQVGNNMEGARDATSLLALTVDQAALDNGRFDLANLLALQEEPPSTVFSHKTASVLSKTRAFSPLADQKWVTVALAYVKELDVITAKRLELANIPKPTGPGGGDPNPKAKPNPKRRGKHGKFGSQPQAEEEAG